VIRHENPNELAWRMTGLLTAENSEFAEKPSKIWAQLPFTCILLR